MPFPDADPVGELTVIHDALATAVHEHEAGAVTLKVPGLLSFVNAALDGAIS